MSQLTSNLFIGKTPKGSDWDDLVSNNVKLVINMRVERKLHIPKYLAEKIELLWLPTIDFFLFTISPKTLSKGVNSALEVINKGSNVYVHCREGRHRSVAMVACILIAQGMTTEGAIALIKKNHPSGDPDASHICRAIENFAAEYNQKAT